MNEESAIEHTLAMLDKTMEERDDYLMHLARLIAGFKMNKYLPNLAEFPDCMKLIEDIEHEITVRPRVSVADILKEV